MRQCARLCVCVSQRMRVYFRRLPQQRSELKQQLSALLGTRLTVNLEAEVQVSDAVRWLLAVVLCALCAIKWWRGRPEEVAAQPVESGVLGPHFASQPAAGPPPLVALTEGPSGRGTGPRGRAIAARRRPVQPAY